MIRNYSGRSYRCTKDFCYNAVFLKDEKLEIVVDDLVVVVLWLSCDYRKFKDFFSFVPKKNPKRTSNSAEINSGNLKTLKFKYF